MHTGTYPDLPIRVHSAPLNELHFFFREEEKAKMKKNCLRVHSALNELHHSSSFGGDSSSFGKLPSSFGKDRVHSAQHSSSFGGDSSSFGRDSSSFGGRVHSAKKYFYKADSSEFIRRTRKKYPQCMLGNCPPLGFLNVNICQKN